MYPHQAERLTEILDRHGLEALVASREANVAYVTGFRGVSHTVFEAPQYAVFTRRGTGLVVPAVEIASIVADGIEVDQIACFGDVVATYDERAEPNVKRIRDLSESRVPDAVEALGRVLDALGVRAGTVALDEGRVTHEAWQRIAARLEARRLVPGAEHFLSARRVKGPWEIECLVRGLGIVEEALNEVIAKIAPGMTEREAVTLYQSEVLKRGGEPVPATIATGTRTWIPRPRATDRALRAGEIVRFDVGGVFDGYQATVARTAVAGDPHTRLDEAYRAVQAGLDAALDAIKPGVPGSRPHAAALEATRAAGLTSFTVRDVGHAIGLVAYEPPILADDVDTPFEAGEVLLIELRHFEMGWVGLHAKDTVLVTTGGARSLNRSSHGLVVLD